jgi:TrmH family RNA methyltransferase
MITSDKNERIKALAKLKTKKYRYRESSFLVEGERFVEAAKLAGVTITCLVMSEEYEDPRGLANGVEEVLLVSRAVFDGLSQTEHGQGVLAAVRRPLFSEDTSSPEGLWVGLEDLRDPGNLGTILRTCDVFGVRGVVIAKGTVDPYNDKALRASMGSIFHVPLYQTEDLPAFARKIDAMLVASSPVGEEEFDSVRYAETTLLLIGNEANGLSEDLLGAAARRVKIPIAGQAESLNAAMAAGIMIYGIGRLRGL